MNQLTIPTPFNDVSELTENFATRVDETPQIMLPYHEPVEAGQWLQFTVQLADGTTALEGTGRSTDTLDNGEEYPPEYRFDVVLDSLQFDGMSEVMFERILQARATQLQGEPGTGEVDVNQLAAAPAEAELGEAAEEAAPHDLPTEALPIEPSAPMEAVADVPDEVGEAAPEEEAPEEAAAEAVADDVSEAAPEEMPSEEWAPEPEGFAEQIPTQAVQLEDLRAAPASVRPAASAPPPPRSAPSAAPAARPSPPAAPAARPSPPSRPRGTLPAMHTFAEGILTRPSTEPSWAPAPTPRPEAAQSSGFFDYEAGLPRPAQPPRPELADEQRVAPAPSPSAPWSRPADASA
jgi:hypothetical protein